MTTASAPEPVPFTSADQYVGDRIYIEMRRRRLSQSAVAGYLGMGQSNLSKKLAGERGWSLDELLTASRYFAISLDELMPGSDYVPMAMRDDAVDEIRARAEAKLQGRNAESPDPREDRGDQYGIRDSNPEPADSEQVADLSADLSADLGAVVTMLSAAPSFRLFGDPRPADPTPNERGTVAAVVAITPRPTAEQPPSLGFAAPGPLAILIPFPRTTDDDTSERSA